MLGADYRLWSKKQLIERVRQLENPLETPRYVGPAQKKKKPFDFSSHPTRFVALRFAYLGWNYLGLAYQGFETDPPTVEGVLLDAMAQTKLIEAADPASCGMSRCGRTDKGVSALNQVIALHVRLALPLDEQGPENDTRELPYLTILNSKLPPEIRVTAICLRPPPGFNARFSCVYRHYKYLFPKAGLDTAKMAEAARLFEGKHDFRNYCKIDGLKQITNFGREIMASRIDDFDSDFCVFDLKGTAFLWHQVRCMVAVLLLVGQGLEPVSIVTDLLDIGKYPSRPAYNIGHDTPLVLYDCKYPAMEWMLGCDFGELQQLKLVKEQERARAMNHELQVQARMLLMMTALFTAATPLVLGPVAINVGSGAGKTLKKYVPVSELRRCEEAEVANAKHQDKKARI